MQDPRFERVPCSHKGTYADDCLCERVKAHRCYIVATCDRDLRRRIRKVLAWGARACCGRGLALLSLDRSEAASLVEAAASESPSALNSTFCWAGPWQGVQGQGLSLGSGSQRRSGGHRLHSL